MRVVPNVIKCERGSWERRTTQLIRHSVDEFLGKGNCSLMLTGGTSAERLYRYWCDSYQWHHDGIRYFFGDERCVGPEHAESNFAMVKRVLFAKEEPPAGTLYRMRGEAKDRDVEAIRYAALLPDELDIMLLSVGPDGHIASLFPGGVHEREHSKLVIPVIGAEPPFERYTITPDVIRRAKRVFLFAVGKAKGKVLARALLEEGDVSLMPVRYAVNGSWILDHEAAECFQSLVTRDITKYMVSNA